MQWRSIARGLGLLLLGEGVLMLPSWAVALIYGGGDAPGFLLSIGILVLAGVIALLLSGRGKTRFYARDGFVLVGIGWLLLAMFGALPYMLTGVLDNYIDALFESVSGFSTTGASVFASVEHLPKGILFWRTFSQWVGGMGVLLLTMAILPQLGSTHLDILRAESPGPTTQKLMPRLGDTAKILYGIYIGMSGLLVVLLLFAGLPLFDALVTTFATAGTGGSSVFDVSLSGYNNPAVEGIVGIFMLLFGVNFAVYFLLLTRQFRRAFKNVELVIYGCMILASVVLVGINIFPIYGNIGTTIRHTFFQVSASVTTTAFYTVDYQTWPHFSQLLLFLLMIVGSCAGSTGGGMKISRIYLLIRTVRRETEYIFHPRIVRHLTMDGKRIDDKTLHSVLVFFFAYMAIAVAMILVVSLDNLDFETTVTSVLATLSNAGLGLGRIGPSGNYGDFSLLSKAVLAMNMLIGRLEILPILMLLHPSTWRKV